MNYFVFANGCFYLCAAVHSLWMKHPMWAFVWFSYGTSAMALAFLEGK